MSRSGQYVQQVSGYKAFMPNALPFGGEIEFSKETQTLLSEADKALLQLDGLGKNLPNHDLFLSMHVRKEALLSSQIEGTQATLEDVLTFEAYDEVESFDDVEEVVNYIEALQYGLERLQNFPMSIRVIKELHAILMDGVRGADKTPGEFRRSQNWIGPQGHGLKQARYVPPPMDLVPELMGDLEQFMHNEGTGHHLIDCALIHYQFETIHPFLDGNGRVGRILIPIFLCWKGLQTYPLLYLSLFLKIHRQEYFDRMMLLRKKGDYEQWINFFLEGVSWTAKNAQDSIRSILTLKEHLVTVLEGDSRCSLKSVQLLDLLFLSPIVTIGSIAEKLGMSRQWTTTQVAVFEDLNILKEITGKRRGKRYLFADYLAILDSTN